MTAYSASIACILRGDSDSETAPAGTGIVLDKCRVLTCAHVVNEASGQQTFSTEAPSQKISLTLPWRQGGSTPFEAYVVKELWFPPSQAPEVGKPEDLAVLALTGDAVFPEDTSALFVDLDLRDEHNRKVWLTGFPGTQSSDRISGLIHGLTSEGRIQIDPALSDRVVAGGFSGAGIWDEHCDGIIGMLIAKRKRGEATIAYGVPVNVIAQAIGLQTTRPADKYANQFHSLIDDATTDFVGRDYIFRAIDQFVANHPNGYLTIVGDPGMGKTAILAKYVQQSDCVAYFNERSMGRNRATQFLESVCAQLVGRYRLPYTPLPPKATEEGSFFLRLLDEIGPRLGLTNRLVIAVDALDEVDLTAHASGANILYLPERLPDHVYFLMTRRRMDLPLRLHVPQNVLSLLDYHNDSQRDVQTYIRQAVEDETRQQLRAWIARQAIETDDFVASLTAKSDDNFMYLRHVMWALNHGDLYNDRNLESLPVGLQGYYRDHWQHMRGRSGDDIWFNYKLPVIVALTVAKKPISIQLIKRFSKVRERARIRSVLDEWSQFLRSVDVDYPGGSRKCYRFYHPSFHDFVASLEEVEDERVNLLQMVGQITDRWGELLGDE